MTTEELTRSIYEANCHIVQLTDSLNDATRERDEARARLEETEHAMHMRIRAGYDACVADAWRAKVASVERERDEARAQLAAHDTKVFITELERGEIRHVAYVAGGFYTREAIAEWAKKALGFERADEIRRLTIPDHKQFGSPDEH
jgi:hypothetical protein